MTSFRQIYANRRNARKSTGPLTQEGKQRSRCNAVRHGLTAETVIAALEDAEDYKAFEAAVIADYDGQSAVERELVLRLASLLWRLRRATIIETGLFPCGTVDEQVSYWQDILDKVPCEYLCLIWHYAQCPKDVVIDEIDKFMTKVVPRLNVPEFAHSEIRLAASA